MEAYFLVQRIKNDEERIEITTLKLEAHALIWQEAYLDSITSFDEPLVIRWGTFKELLQDQFYPLGHHQKQTMEWFDFKQSRGQSVQEYTIKFKKRATLSGVSLKIDEILLKYIRGFHSYLHHTILLFKPMNLDEVCVQA